jgi:acetylornithine deacetylase/succinyl-diaminopimelate desuccinylase-like protein
MLTFAALYATLRPHPPHPVVLAATVAEEGAGDLAGARALFAPGGAGAHARAAFALDGAGDERIVTHAVGVRRLSVHFAGSGGHSWAAAEVPNPVHAAACFAAEVSQFALPDSPRTTIAVTRFHGGHAVNAIPLEACVDLEVRSTSGTVVHDLVARVERAAHRAREREADAHGASRPLELAIVTTSNRPAGFTPATAAPVQALLAATQAIGRTPELAMASTDANIPISLGIPAVSLGMGGVAGQTHTPNEWFENRDGALGIARAAAAILMSAGLG